MISHWDPGDLAICIRDNWSAAPALITPVRHRIYRVLEVFAFKARVGLMLEGCSADHYFDASWFRKIEKDVTPGEASFAAAIGKERTEARA